MAKIYLGSKSFKMNLGDKKIKQGYLGNKKFYSSGAIVTYHIDDKDGSPQQQIEFEEGDDCLKIDFTPYKKGWTFYGWANASGKYEKLEKCIMKDEPIDLYAIFTIECVVNIYNGTKSDTKKLYKTYNNDGYEKLPLINLVEDDLSSSGWKQYGWDSTERTGAKIIENYDHAPETYNYGISSNVTFYAVYTQDVTLYTYNGSSAPTTSKKTRGRLFKNKATNDYNPSFEVKEKSISGWTANGWTDDDTSPYPKQKANFETSIDMKLTSYTYYSIYTKPVTVNWYSSNTSENETQTGIMSQIYSHSPINIPATFKYPGSIDRYEIWNPMYWTTSESNPNADKFIEIGQQFESTVNRNLYVLYERTVDVIYDGNGGKTSSGASSYFNKGDAKRTTNGTIQKAAIPLLGNDFIRSGWTYKGWNRNKNASDGEAIIAYEGYEDVRFYAIWKHPAFSLADIGYPKSNWSSTEGHTSEGYDADGVNHRTYYRKDIANKTGGTTIWTFSIDRRGCDTLTLTPASILITDQSIIRVSCGNTSYDVKMNPSQQHTDTLTFNLANTSSTATLKFEFTTSTNDKAYEFYGTNCIFS